jgi:hypothetical protein
MELDDFASSMEAATEFDAIVDRALDEREKQYGGAAVFRRHHLREKRVATIASAYRDGGVYPRERTPDFVARAIDVKLQFYVTGEVVSGLINRHYYSVVHEDPSAAKLESVRLLRLSLQQDLITKSRILWDRIMAWVYFIETGRDGIPRSGDRSAKRTFFDMCDTTPCWKWLGAYRADIMRYDERFRTPEVHSLSTLRARLMKNEDGNEIENEILGPLNDAMNQVWENIISIVSGGGVVSLGMPHQSRDENGDPDLSVNPFDEWGWQPNT